MKLPSGKTEMLIPRRLCKDSLGPFTIMEEWNLTDFLDKAGANAGDLNLKSWRRQSDLVLVEENWRYVDYEDDRQDADYLP